MASQQEILAFIAAAERFPPSPQKALWVAFLIKQFELRCEVTVIKGVDK